MKRDQRLSHTNPNASNQTFIGDVWHREPLQEARRRIRCDGEINSGRVRRLANGCLTGVRYPTAGYGSLCMAICVILELVHSSFIELCYVW